MRIKSGLMYLLPLGFIVGFVYLPVFSKAAETEVQNAQKAQDVQKSRAAIKNEHAIPDTKTAPSKKYDKHAAKEGSDTAKSARSAAKRVGSTPGRKVSAGASSRAVGQGKRKKTQSSYASARSAAHLHTQRIIVLRHGERSTQGQLNCRGLNRSLALPDILMRRYGTPAAIYAPNPVYRKKDGNAVYTYTRALATIEPTAIRLGVPINTQYGFNQIEALKTELLAGKNARSEIWVVWEHKEAVEIGHALFKELGINPRLIEKSRQNDFERIDVIEIQRTSQGKVEAVNYRKDKEGLEGLPKKCATLTAH